MYEAEWETRQQRIDGRLRAAGWAVRPLGSGVSGDTGPAAITEYPTANGPADYALFADGRPLAIVEAKRVGLAPQGVLPQAERYARGLTGSPFDFDGVRVPFLYATNGERIWFHDVRHPANRSRAVAHFHTPGALQELLSRDQTDACAWLAATPNAHPKLRPYQAEANAAVEAAIAERKRRMLVAMATGTGKTFTTVNQVYRLLRSGVGRRILFLVDRRALAAQAVRAFASFEPEPGLKFNQIYEVYSQRFQQADLDDAQYDPTALPNAYLTEPKAGTAFVYVCTIQRMAINVLGRNAVFGLGDEELDADADQVPDLPIHAFDVIVADECHRGYTAAELSVWRQTLDHFDAIKIGLTATPAVHTKAYFTDVVFRYEYERAVREGYLVDYDVVTVNSDVRLNGVFLEAGAPVEAVDPTTGAQQLDFLEDERPFDASQIERAITAPDSNRKILGVVKEYADAHQATYGRFPKTLVFAVNDLPHVSHADQLVDLARDVFGQGEAFVQKITGRVDRPLQRIREFRNRPQPAVAVTVDLLTTGVDIPDLEYIVFLRPVKSRILFEQMLGRGTRTGDQVQKSHFTVFDCFDGTLLQYFRSATGITYEPPDQPSRTIGQLVEDIWQNRDRDYHVRCLVKRLQRVDKEMAGDARTNFAAFVPDGDVARYAAHLPGQLRADFTSTMALLRDPAFQHLLVHYPRPPRSFLVAAGVEDTVSAEWHARDASGQEYKPEDYLAAFARYVRENPAHVEAIQILLDRPREWSTAALKELRHQLATAPERFTEDQLRKAHAVRYHVAAADIISMVKLAAGQAPSLFTAQERAALAVQKVAAGRELTDEQRQWLERIRDHLAENLTLEQDDFDLLPVFTRAGGWGRANRAFAGTLPELITHLNEAIAA